MSDPIDLLIQGRAHDLGDGFAVRRVLPSVKRRMVGQAPYVVNLGTSYISSSGKTSATLLFNRVGARIQAAGDLPLPDVVQKARDVLDFSLRFPLLGSVSGRFDAKNLLDEPFKTMQGTVVRESWTSGRVFQLGMILKP